MNAAPSLSVDSATALGFSLVLLLSSSSCSGTSYGGSNEQNDSTATGTRNSAAESSGHADKTHVASAATLQGSDSSLVSLPCCGTVEMLVPGIKAAENALFSSDDRLFVTGDEGIFEVTRDASGLAHASNLHPGENCLFTGITEVDGVLYSVCSDFADAVLFAARLDAAPRFRRIHTMNGVPIANGLAADSEGRIYVAGTLLATIFRLTLQSGDPFAVELQESWLRTPGGIAPNGLKFFDSSIYYTDMLAGTINRVPLRSDGTPGRRTGFAKPLQFFDDLDVNSNGFVVASYLSGSVRAYGFSGVFLGRTSPGSFTNPSAVIHMGGRLGYGTDDLLVTDKGANAVMVYRLD